MKNIKLNALSGCKLFASACVALLPHTALANTLVLTEPLSSDTKLYYIIGATLLAAALIYLVLKSKKENDGETTDYEPDDISRSDTSEEPPTQEPPTVVFTGTTPTGLHVSFSILMSQLIQVKGFGLGREDDNKIQICEPSVSRYHAEVRARDGFIWLGDLGSSNGTFINGHKLNTKQFVKLHTGDSVKIGKVEGKVSVQY